MEGPTVKQSTELLSNMFGLSESICLEILKENGFDVDRAVDEIFTLKSINGSLVRPPPVKQAEDPESVRQLKALEVEAQSERDRQERILKNAPPVPKPEEKKDDQVAPKVDEKTNLNVGKAAGRDRDILYASVDPAVYARNFLEKKRAEEAERNRLRNEAELDRQKAEIARLKELEKEEEKKRRGAARLEAEEAKRLVLEAEKEKAALKAKLEAVEKEKEALQARLESQKTIDASEDEMMALQREAKAFLARSLLKPSAPSAPAQVPSTPEKAASSSNDSEAEFLVPGQKTPTNIMSQLATLGQKSISHNEDLPLFQVYFDSTTSPEVVKKAISFISTLGVAQSEIRSLDISEDFELKGYLKSQQVGNDLALPYVFIKKNPLGSYGEVKTFDLNKLKDCVAKARSGADGNPRDILAPNDSAQRRPQLGYFDSALGGVETVLSYLNPFAYFRGSPNSDLLAGEGETLFEVLHTNWYGRHLERKFKFLPTAFLRLHPKHGDIRATRPYTDIESVVKNSATFLVISYKNGSSPDWLQATEADTEAMYKLLQVRAPSAKFSEESD